MNCNRDGPQAQALFSGGSVRELIEALPPLPFQKNNFDYHQADTKECDRTAGRNVDHQGTHASGSLLLRC